MKTSTAGIQFIKEHEGFESKPYYDVAGIPTVGYGTVITQAQYNHYMVYPITIQEAEELLQDALTIRFEPFLLKYVKVNLKQNQFDALISFLYNLGEGAFVRFNKQGKVIWQSQVLQLLNKGDYDSAAAQLLSWVYADVKGKKVVVPGLVERRMAENRLFLKGVYS